MTTPAPEHELAAPAPIPVSGEIEIRAIHGATLVHEEAADFGAYFTITFAGTEAPEALLPYDLNRARAYILVSGTGPVYIGSASGVTAMRNGATAGQAPAAVVTSGATLPVTHKQAVWIAPDGTNTATVTVAVERWES